MPPPETAANDQPLIGAGPPPEIGGERGREDPRSSCGCMACGPPRKCACKCDQHEAAASPPSRRRILTSACQTESPPHGANSRPQPARAWPRHRLLRVCGVGSAIIWGQRCGAYRQHTARSNASFDWCTQGRSSGSILHRRAASGASCEARMV